VFAVNILKLITKQCDFFFGRVRIFWNILWNETEPSQSVPERNAQWISKHQLLQHLCDACGLNVTTAMFAQGHRNKETNILRDPMWETDVCSDNWSVHKPINRPHVSRYGDGEGYCWQQYNYVSQYSTGCLSHVTRNPPTSMCMV
jgi:hypothetical protein